MSAAAPWWKTVVAYQIYPRSFADANGDGVGDLTGIRRHLDHLTSLGVGAVWLSPFFPSPMADFGYDVSDYCDVDPVFGTLDEADALIAEAHERGVKVLVDFVLNHTSDQHPWFLESRSSRDAPKRAWYHWHDGGPDGGPPNNWTASFVGGPAWTLDEPTGQWYLHQFLSQQPDLNWDNPEVAEAMHEVVRFWLDRGADGLRLDAVHTVGKDPAYHDDPPDDLPHVLRNDDPRTHEVLRGLRRLADSYPGDRVLLGEVYLLDTGKVAPYYGVDDELHLCFNFPPLWAPWQPSAWRGEIERVQQHFDPIAGWPTWCLSNHDHTRHRTRFGSEARARAAAVLLLTLRGTPFLYAGEELGLEDAVVPDDRRLDPGGRDGCRAPLPWTVAPPHGWDGADTWLPFPPHADLASVEAQEARPGSMLHLYRRLISARQAAPALQLGDLRLLDAPDGTLAWERVLGDERWVVVVGFSDEAVQLGDGPWSGATVEVASDGAGEGQRFAGTLGPSQAVLLAA